MEGEIKFFSFVVGAAERVSCLLMKEFYTLGALNDERGAMAPRVQSIKYPDYSSGTRRVAA